MALVASSIPHSVRQACSFDDGALPSTCQIIRQLGIGKTRFYRYRNELEAFGLIEVENTITSGGGVAKYSFPDEPVPTAEAEEILITRLINNNNKAMPEVGLTIPQRPKCKAATLGSNALKTRSNTVGISKTQSADRTAHTEHIE